MIGNASGAAGACVERPGLDFPHDLLLSISVLIVGWTVLLRRIYMRVLVGKRLSPDSFWSYVFLPVFGVLIWAPSGAVAIYGLIVFFSLGSFV